MDFGNNTYAKEVVNYNAPQATPIEQLKKEQSDMSSHQIEMASEQIAKLYEGDTPIAVSIDEKTGIVAEVYEVKESLIQPMAVGWQEIATDWFTYKNDNKFRSNPDTVAYSGGGDFGIRISAHSATGVPSSASNTLARYSLYEYDPQNQDDYVSTVNVNGPRTYIGKYDVVWRNIGDYVDGTNGKAEFYVAHAENYSVNNLVQIWYID